MRNLKNFIKISLNFLESIRSTIFQKMKLNQLNYKLDEHNLKIKELKGESILYHIKF